MARRCQLAKVARAGLRLPEVGGSESQRMGNATQQFVKPYIKSNENDFNDAEAIAEAATRATMRCVPLTTDNQLELQAIHCVRARFVAERTAIANQMRAFLLERGITVPVGRTVFARHTGEILENAEIGVSVRMRELPAGRLIDIGAGMRCMACPRAFHAGFGRVRLGFEFFAQALALVPRLPQDRPPPRATIAVRDRQAPGSGATDAPRVKRLPCK